MNKLLIIGAMLVLLVGFVNALYLGSVTYSEPTYNNGSAIEWKEAKQPPIKIDCPRDEWNKMFEDYRADLISKENMTKYIRGCKW